MNQVKKSLIGASMVLSSFSSGIAGDEVQPDQCDSVSKEVLIAASELQKCDNNPMFIDDIADYSSSLHTLLSNVYLLKKCDTSVIGGTGFELSLSSLESNINRRIHEVELYELGQQ